MDSREHPILLFDGVCNLCNALVQFVIRHDPKHIFRFASLQGAFGQEVLQKYNLPLEKYGSAILLEDGKIYTQSTASLRVAKRLSGGWPLLYAFILIPAFIRNAAYDLVARKRYKWFGKKETCWVPTPELRNLFIE